MRYENCRINTFTRPFCTKRDNIMLTYVEAFLSTKSHVPLVGWSHAITWHITIVKNSIFTRLLTTKRNSVLAYCEGIPSLKSWTFHTWSRNMEWHMYTVISTHSLDLWPQTLNRFWFMIGDYHLQSNTTLWSRDHIKSCDVWRSWQGGNLWRGLSLKKATRSFDYVFTWHQVTNKIPMSKL